MKTIHLILSPKCNQQGGTLLSLFISIKCFACLRGFLRPSSGARNVHKTIEKRSTLLFAFWEYIEDARTYGYQIHLILQREVIPTGFKKCINQIHKLR
jgi:hypothetical protein